MNETQVWGSVENFVLFHMSCKNWKFSPVFGVGHDSNHLLDHVRPHDYNEPLLEF